MSEDKKDEQPWAESVLEAGGIALLQAAGLASTEYIEAHKLLDELGVSRTAKGETATLTNRIRALSLGLTGPKLVDGSPIIRP